MSQEQLPARTATRAPLQTGVKLQFDDAVDVMEGVCKNISIGGIQVYAEDPRPQGTLVRFELDIEEGLVIRGLGEVVWMRTTAAHTGSEPSMGIKFRFIEQRDRQIIFKLVSEHIKERLAQKHPGMDEQGEPVAPPSPVATPAPEPPGLADAPTVITPAVAEPQRPLQSIEELMSSQESAAPPLDLDQSFLNLGDSLSDAADKADPPVSVPPPPPQGPSADDTSAHARAESGYMSEELYRPRAARRREIPVVPIVLLLLIGGCVAIYLYWDRIFGPPAPPSGPAMVETSQGSEGTQGSEGAQGPEAVQSPEAAPPESTSGPSEVELNALPPVDQPPPLRVEEAPPPRPAPPPPSRPAPPPPSRPAPPPPPQAANLPAFTRIVDISWTRRPGGVKVNIETNGAISERRFSHFRLDGESPREVVKLKGVTTQYTPNQMTLTGSPVSQIRVGYHPRPKEIHIVLDMLDDNTRISQIRIRGKVLEVLLE